jgi:integrase
MGRPRKHDKHLPQRVYFENGRYWFKPKKPRVIPLGFTPRIDLGTTLVDMYDGLKDLVQTPKPFRTMSVLFDRYLLESLANLAPRTQSDYRRYIERLRPVLDDWEPSELTAGDIFDIRATIAQVSGVVQANRHASCLSAIFRDAIGWKAVTVNPCLQLKRLREPPRTRYVFDHEFSGIYSIASGINQVMMDLATITGQREGDLLKLPNRDPIVYTEEGIIFRPGKSKRRHPRHGAMVETAKTVIVEWSPELREVIERARKLGPDIRKTLICNLQGQPFTESGFRSNWHRLIQTGLKGRKKSNGEVALEPVIKESFTFHDLRAKSGSDAEDVQEANDRLAHDDLRTTQVVYRRKPRHARAGRKVAT